MNAARFHLQALYSRIPRLTFLPQQSETRRNPQAPAPHVGPPPSPARPSASFTSSFHGSGNQLHAETQLVSTPPPSLHPHRRPRAWNIPPRNDNRRRPFPRAVRLPRTPSICRQNSPSSSPRSPSFWRPLTTATRTSTAGRLGGPILTFSAAPCVVSCCSHPVPRPLGNLQLRPASRATLAGPPSTSSLLPTCTSVSNLAVRNIPFSLSLGLPLKPSIFDRGG